jgi:hypothetical protein
VTSPETVEAEATEQTERELETVVANGGSVIVIVESVENTSVVLVVPLVTTELETARRKRRGKSNFEEMKYILLFGT